MLYHQGSSQGHKQAKQPGFSSLIGLLCLLISGVSLAAPNLQAITLYKGVTLIQDHENEQRFYYLNSHKSLAQKEGAPDFLYSVNRYIGKKVTSDEGAFWVRGVIKFSTDIEFIDTDYQDILSELQKQHGSAVELVAAPIADSYNNLVYATIEADQGEAFSGELQGAKAASQPLDDGEVRRVYGARKQRFTIGVSGNDANLFWENFAKENLTLSLAYGWSIRGMSRDENDEWQASLYQVNNSLPILVSMQRYPQLFSKNELWQRVRFSHSGLKIMCYDFINLEETDLYYVNVEIRFKTLRGQRYTEAFKFVADSDVYEQDMEFELANDIQDGYEYRVRRLTVDGDMTRTQWLNGRDAWLDVSLSGAELLEQEKSTEEPQL